MIVIPGYMTSEEVARELGVSTGRVRQLVSSNTLESDKFGNMRLIAKASVLTYKKNRKRAGWPKGTKRTPKE